MKTKIKFYHATIEDREQGKDVKCIEFKYTDKFNDNIQHFIDETYCGKMKKVVFIAMIGEDSKEYFVTDNYLKVQDYFRYSLPNNTYFLFEEPTYEEAFLYCKDNCEVHELGLENKYLEVKGAN